MRSDFPRVLLISRAAVGDGDPSGISLGRWFGAWPKDRLAQIYSSRTGSGVPFCPTEYEFGAADRRLGWLFGRAKASSWAGSFRSQGPSANASRRSAALVRRLKSSVVKWIVATGLWERLFATRISPGLLSWARAFAPDLLYSTCTDLSYLQLTLGLSRMLGCRVCLQVDDDWLGALYNRGVGRVVSRPSVERLVAELLAEASLRISNGPLMTEAYLRRYGVPFEPVFLAEDIARFDASPPRRTAGDDEVSIVYSGSLQLDRWEGIIDLDDALSSEMGEAFRSRIEVYTTHLPPEAEMAFSGRRRIHVKPGLADRDVPSVLKGADILFLPESFRERWRTYTRFSISSKAHLYMMAGKPAVVYGPDGIGVVEYARQAGWGSVVDRRDRESLAVALTSLVRDTVERRGLLERARRVALANHELGHVRERFRSLLVECVHPRSEP